MSGIVGFFLYAMQPMIRPNTNAPPFDNGNNIEAGTLSAYEYCKNMPTLFTSPYKNANRRAHGLNKTFVLPL